MKKTLITLWAVQSPFKNLVGKDDYPMTTLAMKHVVLDQIVCFFNKNDAIVAAEDLSTIYDINGSYKEFKLKVTGKW